jgi:tripartite-type tricarboxylate transporter receptor subunit TctC
VRDFEPVSLLVSTAEVLVVGANHPANDVNEFIAYTKKRKDGAAIASSGTGSIPHLAAELFAERSGINMVHVPYKGIAPAITDVIAGQVDGVFIDVPVALAQIKAGKLKALGLAAPQRHSSLPNTKTFQEMGITGVDSSNWYAIFAPKGTPAKEVERLNQAVHRALNDPAVKKQLLAIGAEPSPSSPAELAQLLKNDLDKWGRVIRTKHITAN